MHSDELDKLGCLPRPAFLWDVERRRIVWANAAAVLLFGALSAAELAERPFGPRDIGVRALTEARERLRELMQTDDGQGSGLELELRFPSAGLDRPLRAQVRPYPLAADRAGLLVTAYQAAADVTDRNIFTDILDDIPQPVLALTPAGAPVFANRAAAELLGEEADLTCAFAGESQLRDFLRRALQTGLAVTTRQARTPLGERTLRLIARAGRNDGLVVVSIDDLTDRLRLERMQAAGRLAPELPEAPEAPESPGQTETETEEKKGRAGAVRGLKAEELAALQRIMQALETAPETAERPGAEAAPASGEKAEETAGEELQAERMRPGEPRAAEPADRVKIRIGTPQLPAGKRLLPEAVRAAAESVERKVQAQKAPSSAPAPAAAPQAATPEKAPASTPKAEAKAESSPPAESHGPETPGRLVRVRTASRKPAQATEGEAKAAAPPEVASAQEPSAEAASPRAPLAETPSEQAPSSGQETPGEEAPMPQKVTSEVTGPREAASARSRVTIREGRRSVVDEAATAAAEDLARGPEPPAAPVPEPEEGAGRPEEVAGPELPAEEETCVRHRPEPPAMVREALDHRPDPILLHRSGAFFYANRAARQLFGYPPDDEAWDEMARALAESADGSEVELKDAAGGSHRFRLRRDIFPWRAGMVVQSTLLPLDREGYHPPPVSDKSEQPEGHARATGMRSAFSSSRLAQPSAAAQHDGGAGGNVAGEAKPASRRESMACHTPAPVIRIHTERGMTEEAMSRAPLATASEAAPARPATGPERAENGAEVAMPPEVTQALLESLADGLVLLDAEGRILAFSTGAERLFGMSSEAVQGRFFRELLAQESRPMLDMHLKLLQAETHGHAPRHERECGIIGLAEGGGRVPLCLIIGHLPANGKMRGRAGRAAFYVALHDISHFRQRERELERAREEAERRSARKSEFLAHISHELRTPLNAIIGFAEVLQNEMFGKLGNEQYRAYARDIQKSGKLLLSLVNDLLDLARIESGRYELQPEEVDLAAVLEDTVNLLREQIGEAGVELRRVVPENLPRVVADARSMKQILINLLSNAIKFSGRGGRVVVALRQRPDGGLELAVKDSGPGMSREELAEALEPFRRVQRTGEGKPGSGLGLPLARALARANRARLEIDSEPGQGTEVRVVFPPHRVLG